MNWVVILLYAAGVILVVSEIILPGVILGIVGLACIGGSICWAFQSSAALGWTLLALTAILVPVLAVLWFKVFNRAFTMKMTQVGYTSAQVELKDLVGQEGVAITQLRPAGMARIGEQKVDVVSEGEVIDRDTRIRVLEVRGNRVVVRAVRG